MSDSPSPAPLDPDVESGSAPDPVRHAVHGVAHDSVLGEGDAHALSPLAGDSTCGLRERKKRLTRRALHQAALTLVSERGLDDVTTDEIAAVADVSARTFFNYFPTKDAAVIGMAPDVGERLAAALRARPSSEDLFTAVTTVISAAVSVIEDDVLRSRRRAVVGRDPRLGAAMIGATREVESALVAAATARHDDLPELRVRITVAAVMAATRATYLYGRQVAEASDSDAVSSRESAPDLPTALDQAFAFLAHGLAD